MKIFNVGDRIMNTWIYEIPEGYVMIDTGYPDKLRSVQKRMAAHHIRWSDIRYVFLTHAHDDHAGFLNELLGKCPELRVILNPGSMPALRRGQNSFEGGCSTREAYLFCRCMALWGKGKHLFPRLEEKFDNRLLFITEENREELEQLLHGKILFTPGHTDDSVSLKAGKRLFCGDAAMNNYPSRHHVTIWVENTESFGRSWDVMLNENVKRIYPGHGKPFGPEELIRNRSFIGKVKLYPLKQGAFR